VKVVLGDPVIAKTDMLRQDDLFQNLVQDPRDRTRSVRVVVLHGKDTYPYSLRLLKVRIPAVPLAAVGTPTPCSHDSPH